MLVQLTSTVMVDPQQVAAITETSGDGVVKLALPASTVDITVTGLNANEVFEKLAPFVSLGVTSNAN